MAAAKHMLALFAAALVASATDSTDLLGTFDKSFSLKMANSTAQASSSPHVQALMMSRRKRSSTLDHFNDKIDETCVELAKEVQNASKCLGPAAYDLRVKSMSFQRVLEYYQEELVTFRTAWKSAVKQFTDTADSYVDNPLAGSLIEEHMLFGKMKKEGSTKAEKKVDLFGKVNALKEKKEAAPFDPTAPKINVLDKEAVVKEFEVPFKIQAKEIPDTRDYDLAPNTDQTTGHELDDNEQPMDRLTIDTMKPFPTSNDIEGTGTMSSPYRQKYGEEFNPVPEGEEAPAYIVDAKGGDIFNLEDYAQRYLFWRNEHVSAYNNFIFATGPYQAAALAYASVLRQLAHQVEHQKTTTLLSFEGYNEAEMNKKIMNTIKLYRDRSFKGAKDIVPDDIKIMQQSPLNSCGECSERVGKIAGETMAPEGTCLPRELFPCGPQKRLDGSIALNPYYLWNDQEELWKRRFQMMDSISSYLINIRKISLLERSPSLLQSKVARAKEEPFRAIYEQLKGAIQVVQTKVGKGVETLEHDKKAKEEAERRKAGAAPAPPGDNDGIPTTGHKTLNTNKYTDAKDKTKIMDKNLINYLNDNDINTRWDAVQVAQEDAQPKKWGYDHPIVKTEGMTDAEFAGQATEQLKKELQYGEILTNGRWEKLYNDAMRKLSSDFGVSLDFLREESFQLAFETARDKFDQCSSILKKRVPSFLAVDMGTTAAQELITDKEKTDSPDYRDHVKDLLDRYANAQEGTAVVAHAAMDCTEQGRYELELAANAYKLVLSQMADDTEASATRWSAVMKDLGTAWQGSAFANTLLSVKSLPQAMMQRANGVMEQEVRPMRLSALKKLDRDAIVSRVRKESALKMRTPPQTYSDVKLRFNPRDFIMDYRLAYWKTRTEFINIYKHFVYTVGPYQAATDAYMASMKEFATEIDHKIETFLGKGNDAIVNGEWAHESSYNMFWSSFKNGVGLIRTAKHVVAQSKKEAGYIMHFFLRAFHMQLNDGTMQLAGCDPAPHVTSYVIDGHRYEAARPKTAFQQDGNRLGRGTHPCFLGQYTQNKGYTEALPTITWLTNEYEQAMGSDEVPGDPWHCKKAKKFLSQFRCNGGANNDEVDAKAQYPATEGIPGAARYETKHCVTGHFQIDQALYKLAYNVWLSHPDNTEATSFADWLNYDEDTQRPNIEDYSPCPPMTSAFEYKKMEKKNIVDGSKILKKTADSSVDDCAELCNKEPQCLGYEFGVDYSATDAEALRAGDCVLRSSLDMTDSEGDKVNTDFYAKNLATCYSFTSGDTVKGDAVATEYTIDESVTLKAKKASNKEQRKANSAVKKSEVQEDHGDKVLKKHLKKRRSRKKKVSKRMASYLQIKEEIMARREKSMALRRMGIMSPAGFKALMYCETDDDCDKAPGSEDMPALQCRAPGGEEHVEYDEKAEKDVKTTKITRKFCIGYKDEGEECRQYLCNFGLSCSHVKGGKCVRESHKYHDWWTYDDGSTTHASTNTFGLEYRKARDYFLSCNEGIQKALTGFVDAWAAANQLSHRMENRICGGQVKEQKGTGTELGLLQQKVTPGSGSVSALDAIMV